MRVLAAILLVSMATPAFAAGDGAPTWVYVISCAPFLILPVGFRFFLQGFLRLRNALILMTIASVGFLILLAASYGLEKTLSGLPLFAFMLALFSPLFGLGWFIGIKDAIRRSDRKIALNAGSNHG
jgi:hypothetical protein